MDNNNKRNYYIAGFLSLIVILILILTQCTDSKKPKELETQLETKYETRKETKKETTRETKKETKKETQKEIKKEKETKKETKEQNKENNKKEVKNKVTRKRDRGKAIVSNTVVKPREPKKEVYKPAKPAETKKEVEKPTKPSKPIETEKETVKETEKETPKETEKEVPKETEKETPKETEKETPKETEKEQPKPDKVEYKTRKTYEVITLDGVETKVIEDNTLEEGKVNYIKGQEGKVEITHKDKYVNGKLVSSSVIDRKTVVELVAPKKIVGTKVVDKIEEKTRVDIQAIDSSKLETIEKKSDELEKGKVKEIPGEEGKVEITYKDTFKNGKLISSEEVSRKTLKEAKAPVKLIGTKETNVDGGKVEDKVEYKTRKEIKPIPHNSLPEIVKNDDTQYADYVKEVAGKDGQLEITYKDKYVNGELVSSEDVGTKTLSEAQAKTKIVGTKEIREEKTTEKVENRPASGFKEVKSDKYEVGTRHTDNSQSKPDVYKVTYKEVYEKGKLVQTIKVKEELVEEGYEAIVYIGTRPKQVITGNTLRDMFDENYISLKVDPELRAYIAKNIVKDFTTNKDAAFWNYTMEDWSKLTPEQMEKEFEIIDETYVYRSYRAKDGSIKQEGVLFAEVVRDFFYQNKGVEYLNKTFDADLFNKEMVRLINIDRKAKGITPINVSEVMGPYVQIRADETAAHGHIRYWDYENNRRLTHVRDAKGTPWYTVFDGVENLGIKGENIASSNIYNGYQGFNNEKAIAKAFFQQWKDSPGHYAQMMSPTFEYVYTAIAFSETSYSGQDAKGDKDGGPDVFAVQIFSGRSGK